jgi:hypothetical protein
MINEPNHRGDTILHAVAKSGDRAMVQKMLAFGAYPFLHNRQGRTALDVADPQAQVGPIIKNFKQCTPLVELKVFLPKIPISFSIIIITISSFNHRANFS